MRQLLLAFCIVLAFGCDSDAQQGPAPLLEAVWQHSLDTSFGTPLSEPVLTKDSVLFAASSVMAFDRDSGYLRWSRPIKDTIPLFLSIDRSSVYVPDGVLRALNLSDGREKWNSAPYRVSNFSNVLVRGDSIIAGSDANELIMIDAKNGARLKTLALGELKAPQRQLIGGLSQGRGKVYISTTILDEESGAKSHGVLYCVDIIGWRIDWAFTTDIHSTVRSGFNAKVLVLPEGILAPDGLGNRIYLLSRDGNQLWMSRDQGRAFGIAHGPIVQRRSITFGSWDGKVYTLDRKSGELLLQSNLKTSVFSLVQDDKRTLAFGHQIWVLDNDGRLVSGPHRLPVAKGITTPVVSDGKLIVAGGPDGFFAFRYHSARDKQ